MKRQFCMLILIGLLSAIVVSAADISKLTKERSKRLSKSGRLGSGEKKNLYPFDFPEKVKASVVIRAAQNNGVVKELRFHFSFNANDVKKAGQEKSWTVFVKDLAGTELWKFESATDWDLESDNFWSPPLLGNAVEITVESQIADPVLRLDCDKWIEYVEPIQEKSIVGIDDTVDMSFVTNDDHKRWAKSVARLTFQSIEDKEIYTCTGFLVSETLFVTNEHCPRGDKERKSAIVEFDYNAANGRLQIFTLKTELARNEDLDFAFYELNKPATGRESLKLMTEAQQMPSELLIFQHPAGLPKRLAAKNCQVKTPVTGVQPTTDFGHECDTQGGSSGSPVQTLSGLVVGLHHFGFDPAVTDPELQINQAVKTDAIISHLRERARRRDTKAQRVLRALAISQ